MEEFPRNTPEHRREIERLHWRREIEQLDPTIFVAVMRLTYSLSGRYRHVIIDAQGCQLDPETKDEVWTHLFEYLEDMPHSSPERSRALYEASADSPVAQDREQIAYRLKDITSAKQELGAEIWDKLLRDVDESVRRTTWSELDEHLTAAGLHGGSDSSGDEDFPETDTLFSKAGLNWQLATKLLVAHIDAEQGERLRDPAAGYDPALLAEFQHDQEETARTWILERLQSAT